MLAHHAMPDFRCRSTCPHKECQRHSHLGVQDANETCACLGTEFNASSIFLESVLDLAKTLSQIMIICGIHECKAKSTIDVTTYAFLHYDQVCYCLDSTPKKRLRKEDLFHELGKRCLMNRVEAHLAYTVIKRGFKAFYYMPKQINLDDPDKPSFSEECVYVHAAKKTAENYARLDGLSCEQQRAYEAKIKVAYKKFYDRMVARKTQPAGEDCNCCFCAKKRGHLIFGKEPPCSSAPKKDKKPIKCPYCCQLKKKQKMIHQGRAMAKCPVCHRSRKFCTCAKYHFAIDWVKSVWERPDFANYYKHQIEEAEQLADFICCYGSEGSEEGSMLSASQSGATEMRPQGSKQMSPMTKSASLLKASSSAGAADSPGEEDETQAATAAASSAENLGTPAEGAEEVEAN